MPSTLPIGVALCVLLLAGCGSERPRATVAGTVTWKGQPVAGNIAFQLDDAPAVFASIKDGKYQFDGARQVYVGANRVTIESFIEIEGTIFRGEAPPVKRYKQVLPPKFNSASTLQADVKKGANEIDFHLVP